MGDVVAEGGLGLGRSALGQDLGEELVELGHVALDVGGEGEAAAALQDASAFGEDGVGVGEVVDAEIRDDQIEA
jgi:hypothetical protein